MAAAAADELTVDALGFVQLGADDMEAADFEDYRRADIRFHIGVAEAAR